MRQKQQSAADLIFSLTLFVLFALCALAVVASGANVYRSTVARMDENYATRTAVAYVGEKVRQADTGENRVALTTLAGTPALAVARPTDAGVYTTYLYYSDGALRELLCAENDRVDPAAGQVIAQLDEAGFAQVQPGLYRFYAVGAADEETLLFAVHTAQEDAA